MTTHTIGFNNRKFASFTVTELLLSSCKNITRLLVSPIFGDCPKEHIHVIGIDVHSQITWLKGLVVLIIKWTAILNNVVCFSYDGRVKFASDDF